MSLVSVMEIKSILSGSVYMTLAQINNLKSIQFILCDALILLGTITPNTRTYRMYAHILESAQIKILLR